MNKNGYLKFGHTAFCIQVGLALTNRMAPQATSLMRCICTATPKSEFLFFPSLLFFICNQAGILERCSSEMNPQTPHFFSMLLPSHSLILEINTQIQSYTSSVHPYSKITFRISL